MNRTKKYVFIVVTAIVLTTLLIVMSNPLRWSKEHLKKHLLKITPIGTSMENVIDIIESNEEWTILSTDDTHGYLLIGGTPEMSRRTTSNPEETIGEKSIEAFIGEYNVWLLRRVSAYWAFDENSNLINIDVCKFMIGM